MMRTPIQYLIAQHIPVPLRQEAENVGVLVKHGGIVGCRFIGEDEQGKLDGRRLRSFRFPDVYRQWIQHWRDGLQRERNIEDLMEYNTAHYRVVRGGTVVDVGTDPVEKVVDYLFRLLVKDDGMAYEARTPGRVAGVPSLKREIADAFSQRGLLASSSAGRGLFPRHAIVQNEEMLGTSDARYRPQFSQQNGILYLMEPVDLTAAPSSLERRAGFVAYMYKDIAGTSEDVKALSLVRGLKETGRRAAIRNSICILKNESEIVDWADPSEREGFLEERQRVAEVGYGVVRPKRRQNGRSSSGSRARSEDSGM